MSDNRKNEEKTKIGKFEKKAVERFLFGRHVCVLAISLCLFMFLFHVKNIIEFVHERSTSIEMKEERKKNESNNQRKKKQTTRTHNENNGMLHIFDSCLYCDGRFIFG